jgi:hypothetical protein
MRPAMTRHKTSWPQDITDGLDLLMSQTGKEIAAKKEKN